MNMAKALMKLRELKEKIKDIAQKEDPFGYGELTDASLIESRRAVIAENESIRAQLKKIIDRPERNIGQKTLGFLMNK